ncbi:cell wall hydrolase [Paracoccus sp. SCSIO 75233]|uniref:cell wall hydrolase n=1 Tax=Paracoccus sp. SCSIO 75233 TaxID=3017782 RepID=UPI0022F07B99|nr:cell wall hydrolase [Paracoccus sp. SCSIO 75233]WBU52337.1 cell wall hydrolase [Paracoccus sp. SCSIO 75233]
MTTLTRKISALILSASLALPVTAPIAAADPARGPETLTQARYGGADSLACLTEALYFEARGEGRAGQQAVAEVILNRVDSRAFPGSVCGVIYQRGQFSYKKGRRMSNAKAAARARQIATEALSGAPRDLTDGATYFHTTAVRPSWSRRFTRTTKIGSHIFYRNGRRVASN